MKYFSLISIIAALLLSGCLESNPQPSPGTQDTGNWSPPSQDVADRAQDIPHPLGETAIPGEDCVSGGDLSAPADTAADGTLVDVPLDTMDVIYDVQTPDTLDAVEDIPAPDTVDAVEDVPSPDTEDMVPDLFAPDVIDLDI